MNQEKTGKFIKDLREKKNLTQEELSLLIPIDRGAVSKWERGKTFPDIINLTRLSEIFGVSVDEILAGEKNPKKSVALEIYKEKRKANKMLKISIIIIIFLLFSFFSYYFINQYKSVILYSISGRSTNFKLEGGLFFHTNDKLYFNSGNLINYKNYTIHKIELIYIKNNKEKVLYTLNYNNNGFNNIILDDYKKYNKYFDYKETRLMYARIILRIYYNDTSGNMMLDMEKKYINDNLFFD